MGDAATMLLVGGHPALDFVNTLGGRPDRADDEYLHGYSDLITWCRRSNQLSAVEADHLADTGQDDPAEACHALASAHELRAALDAALRARLVQHDISDDDLATIGQAFAVAVAHGRLESTDSGLQWSWPSPVDLTAPLWPIAVSAVDLLDRTPLDLLGRCHHCRWLYLDTSRNRTRRWCSMNACGGLYKMRRHRARQRSAGTRQGRSEG